MDLKRTLGRNIRYYRFQHSYTQERLAEMLDISTTYMSDIECGKSNVSLDLIEKIAYLFEIPFTSLFEESHITLPNKLNTYKFENSEKKISNHDTSTRQVLTK